MNPVALVLGVVLLVVSALTKLRAVVAGQQVTIPALWLVLAAIVLALAIMLLWLIRQMVRDGLRLRPVVVRT